MGGDNPVAIDPLDVMSLPHDGLATLGDSALGHAVRRALALGPLGAGYSEPDAIAVHDSHL
jgi:hypothetical protein